MLVVSHIWWEVLITEMDHSFRDKLTWTMSQAELCWYMAPPFIFTRYSCMQDDPFPGAQGLQALWWGWRRLQMCIYTAAGLDTASPQGDGFVQTSILSQSPTELWAARLFCSAWSCWLRCLLGLVRVWTLERAEQGTQREQRHSLCLMVRACNHPASEKWGMAVDIPVVELWFGFILGFGKIASKHWQRKGKRESF